jgi:hypothetical protein
MLPQFNGLLHLELEFIYKTQILLAILIAGADGVID